MDILNVIIRTIVILFILFIFVKIIGKKQVSQMNLFDYIVGITMGSVVADISLDIEKSFLSGVVSLTIYCLAGLMSAILTNKSITMRRVINGVPTVLVENGKIIEDGLKKVRIDVNDLLSEARVNGYFNLEDIDYAVMETNGKISFLLKGDKSPLTKGDYKLKVKNEGLTANVIIDEVLLEKNLKDIGKSEKWLKHELKVKGYDSYKGILLATVDNNEKLIIYDKNNKVKNKSVLE